MSNKPDPIPPFDGNGNLPVGDYWPAEPVFVTRFVTVTGSTSRPSIYEGFKRHRTDLQGEGVKADRPCLLNGSFTTSKVDPGDIDLVVELDPDLFTKNVKVQSLLAGKKTKVGYSCDAYPLLVYPQNDPRYKTVTEKYRAYWRKWFGRDRSGNPKGRVWATVQGFR